MSSKTERLIHILLCEELGAETVPDVTEKVLKRAVSVSHDSSGLKSTLRRAAAIAVAAALLVFCVVAGWWTMGHRYPAPEASGAYQLVDATEVCRGAVLVTEDQPASLALGGYCHVRLEPHTALRIEGKQGAEQVLLEKGGVQCEVRPGVGAFAVRSQVGTVSVVGTSFSVKLLESIRAESGATGPQPVPMLAVAVTTGSVSVDCNGSAVKLLAGTEQIFNRDTAFGVASRFGSANGKVTIVGMAKSLRKAGGKPDPNAANATLTVTTKDSQVVYYVHGWAGVILAGQADGKKAAVTGLVAEKDGKKTITGKSMDAKIIIE